MSEVNLPLLMSVSTYTFTRCGLLSASFPNVERNETGGFYNNANLSVVSFPACSYVGQSAFCSCGLVSAFFPKCSFVGTSAFAYCSSLEMISLPSCKNIYSYAFYSCKNLMSLYLLGSTVAPMASTGVFTSTPMVLSTLTGRFGSIFVPASLYSNYIRYSYWSSIAARFVSV